jgi:uncharacterized membrane protein YfcA
MAQTRKFKSTLRRFWPLYIATLPGLVLGVSILKTLDRDKSQLFLGAILLLYALWSLDLSAKGLSAKGLSSNQMQLSPTLQRRLALPVGFATGVVKGITGSQIMPLLPFFLTLNLNKEGLVQGLNFSFTLSSLVMLFLLGKADLLQPHLFGIALGGILPTILGIYLGGKLRNTCPDDLFRKILLFVLLGIGSSLVVRSL